MGTTTSKFERIYAEIREDIFAFAHYIGFDPTWQQAEVLKAVMEAQYGEGSNWIAVKSGQGPGKTTISGIVGLWRTLRAVDAMTVVTAPTMRQCRDVWLAELRRTMENAPPLLDKIVNITASKVEIAKRRDWCVRTVTATKEENAQGFHQQNMTVICEEASGIPRGIIEQFKGTLSNPDALFLMIGNPNCVRAGMDIYDPHNGLIPVEDYTQGMVAGMDEQSLRIGLHRAKGMYSGRKDCVRLTLRSGQEIELSEDHPVYTSRGWVKAVDLADHDMVATPRRLPPPSRHIQVSDDEVKYVAYMLADGCCTFQKGSSPRNQFTQMPGPVLDEFCSLSMVQDNHSVRECRGLAYNVNVRGQNQLLRDIGIAGQNSKTKRVPKEYFLLDDRQLGLFINRFWACDGSFNRYGPKVCLSNRKLLEDLRTLMLRWGIHSRIWYTPTTNRKSFDYLNGRTFDAWTMGITERESVLLFQKYVGEVLGKEGKCPLPKGTNPNSDVVPIDNLRLDELLQGRHPQLRQKYRRRRYLSRAAYLSLCEELGHEDPLCTSDLRWERIKSIEPIGEHDVYDLTVPAVGNFVCENVVVHNTRDCAFFDCFNSQRDRWRCITLNAEDTARDYPHIVSPQRNLDLENEFGRQSDVYRVRVLGEFPHADPNCVVSSEDCEKVAVAGRVVEASRRSDRKQISIDFARFGSDESVIYRRSGEAIVEWQQFSKVDPGVVVATAFRWQQEAGWRDNDCWYVIDAGGIGQGILHRFYDANKRVVEFHNGGTAVKSRMYANRITEAWFTLARKIVNQEVAIPNDNQLIQQLCSRQYKIDNKGRMILESKDDYKKRGPFPSPDRADSLVMAFYDELSTPTRFAGKHQDEIIGARKRPR